MATAALIVGAVAVGGSAIAGAVAAGEQEDAAAAQQRKALKLARASPREMKEAENAIRQSEKLLNREMALINAVDPAIMEASKQAFDMLKGKEAAILDPLRQERARQKTELSNTLRRQLGPGFETSSAGIEALANFDRDTSLVLAQTQQQTTLELLGVAQRGRSQAQAGEATALQFRGRAATIFQNIKARKVAAATGTAPQVVAAAGGTARAIGKGLGQIGGIAAFAGSGGFDQTGKTVADKTAGIQEFTGSLSSSQFVDVAQKRAATG